LQEGVHEKNAFMAPEVFAGQRVSGKIDVWGMGMTLFYMLYGCSPWPHAKDSDWHRRLGSTIVYPEGYDVPAKLKQCIEKMLVYDPEMRIGAKELARLFGG
jgi:serine/threonine protein kinase